MNDTYAAYLLSEAWANKRDHALAIYQHRCAACGTSERLHVHHLTYERIFREEMSDLLVLCQIHHEAAEEMVRKGIVSRIGDPAALAAETLRFIAPAPRVPPAIRAKKQKLEERRTTRKEKRKKEREQRPSICQDGISKEALREVIYQLPGIKPFFQRSDRAGLKVALRAMLRKKDRNANRILAVAFAMFDFCPQYNPALPLKKRNPAYLS